MRDFILQIALLVDTKINVISSQYECIGKMSYPHNKSITRTRFLMSNAVDRNSSE